MKNRIFIALNWLWIYLTGYRSARLITQDMPTASTRKERERSKAA
jgi:NADH:ubiquinone reductase (H+-translocating)